MYSSPVVTIMGSSELSDVLMPMRITLAAAWAGRTAMAVAAAREEPISVLRESGMMCLSIDGPASQPGLARFSRKVRPA
jgi:hypothetical protein